MAGFESRACPFCRANEIQEHKGSLRCAYCREVFEYVGQGQGEGYLCLRAYNFDAAHKHFALVDDKYGLFLAAHRIDENPGRSGIAPVVFAYRPDSFAEDDLFRMAKTAREPGIPKKLDTIEKARAATQFTCGAADAVLAVCRPEYNEFAKALAAHLQKLGYKPEITGAEPGDDVLRGARILAAVGGSDAFASDLQTGFVRRFFLLENNETHIMKAAVMLYPSGTDRMSLRAAAAQRLQTAETEPDGDPAAVWGRLSLPAPRKMPGLLFMPESQGPAVAMEKGEDISAPPTLPPLKNEGAEIARARDMLMRGAFPEAAKITEKLMSGGCGNAELYLLRWLAAMHQKSEADFIAAAPAFGEGGKFRDAVTYHPPERRDQLFALLLDAVLTAMKAGRVSDAGSLFEAVCGYAASKAMRDAYAERLLTAAENLPAGCTLLDIGDITYAILDGCRREDASFQRTRRRRFIQFAMEARHPYAAQYIENLLSSDPGDPTLLAYRLFAQNGASGFGEFIAKDGAVLGDRFAALLSAQGSAAGAAACLDQYFDAFLQRALKEMSFKNTETLLGELLRYVAEGKGVSPRLICNAGDAALAFGDYQFAKMLFYRAIERDAKQYRAYWGMLKASLSCADDRMLEICDTDIETVENFFSSAYAAAHEAGDSAFCSAMNNVKMRQSGAERMAGHVFLAGDYEILEGRLLRYNGRGVPNVYLPPSVYMVGPGAFFGSDIVSVLVGRCVTEIGSEAFAWCERLQTVTLPAELSRIGVNPFAACTALRSIVLTGSNLRMEDGILCQGGRAVAALPGKTGTLTLPDSIRAVGAKCFYGAGFKGLHTVNLGNAEAVEACAFYNSGVRAVNGKSGAALSGKTPAVPMYKAFTGAPAFGANRNAPANWDDGSYGDWDSLLGSGGGNIMRAGAGSGKSERRKLLSLGRPLEFGLLIREGRLLMTSGSSVWTADLPKLMEGGQQTTRYDLSYEVVGSGALWEDYLVLPLADGQCALTVLGDGCKTLKKIALPAPVTRGLLVWDRYCACVCGSNLVVADLVTGKLCLDHDFGESLLIMPVLSFARGAAAFVTGTYSALYEVSVADFAPRRVCPFSGENIVSGSSVRVLRNRVTAYGGSVYWIEVKNSAYQLMRYDGRTVRAVRIPYTGVHCKAQPVFYNNTAYIAMEDSVAKAVLDGEDWRFSRELRRDSRDINDLCIAGGQVLPFDDGAREVVLRAVYQNAAVIVNAKEGDVFVTEL